MEFYKIEKEELNEQVKAISVLASRLKALSDSTVNIELYNELMLDAHNINSYFKFELEHQNKLEEELHAEE